MKKQISIILVVTLLLSLCSCVKNSKSDKKSLDVDNIIILDVDNYQKYIKLVVNRTFDWEGFAGGKSAYSHLRVIVSFEGLSQNYEYTIEQIDFKVSVKMLYLDGEIETIEKTGSINSFDISGASINKATVELSGDKSFPGDEGYADCTIEVTAVKGSLKPLR